MNINAFEPVGPEEPTQPDPEPKMATFMEVVQCIQRKHYASARHQVNVLRKLNPTQNDIQRFDQWLEVSGTQDDIQRFDQWLEVSGIELDNDELEAEL